MNTSHAIATFCLLGVAACNSQNSNGQPSISELQQRVLPSDSEILSAVYDNFYQVPEDFFVDERSSTAKSYSLYHVKDASLSYELCTDDYQQAFAWELSDSRQRHLYGTYVESYENDRYFEFVRELSFPDSIGNISDLTSLNFARVFKCSYVNRDGVDRNLRDGYAGTLNVSSPTNQSIRAYSEYMWQFTFFWPAQKKVLQTHSLESNDKYEHTLVLGFLTNRGTDQCDLIEIVDWTFSVDKSNGRLSKEFNFLFSIDAELLNGVPTKCG